MGRWQMWLLAGVLVVAITGCEDTADVGPFASYDNGDANNPGNGEDGTPEDPGNDPQQPQPLDRYALANGCFVLKSVSRGRYVQQNGAGEYTASATGARNGAGFYMKPTDLGKYMFYTPGESLLAASDGSLAIIDAPANETGWIIDDGVEFTIDSGPDGTFTVVSESAGKALAVDGQTGRLHLMASGGDVPEQRFDFAEGSGCADFPEIGVQAQGETYQGNGVDRPVLGFADIHNHISATDFLGGDHVGRPFDRFGVTEALPNGSDVHGPTGRADLIGNLYGNTPVASHDTQGWPTFNDWPARTMLTHEGTYYRWIKRAWLAGLRVLNNNVVENQTLCALQSVAQNINLSDLNLEDLRSALAGPIGDECSEMDNAVDQIGFMRRMQDYIDAQNGGPGEGWFRIVESPRQAREVINQGKLAVYLGIEVSHLFNCDLTKVATTLPDTVGCTREDIDEQLDRIHELGVRQVNMMHEFNNGLGGNGIFNDFILNVGNFVDTGGFWKTNNCPEGDYLYAPGSVLTSLDPLGQIAPDNPLSGILSGVAQGLLPVYPNDKRQCNARGLTKLGRYALEKVMEKGMIIDVDHMSLKMKGEVIDIARQQDPVYPLISTHGGHGGISTEQARAIYELGGLVYPMSHEAKTMVDDMDTLRALKSDDHDFAVGYGADTNGLAAQPRPRGEDARAVTYPFSLFSGPGWGPRLDTIAPVMFDQSAVAEGDRYFDINTEGVGQYGLFADWVETIRIEGGQEALGTLYDSAEVFLQMWQRTIDR